MNGRASRLAVILHADVAGSTSLVQRDERVAHERITGAMKRLAAHVRSYDGTAREIRGDALVAEFARASDAVCAALAFQAENVAANRDLADDLVPAVRIGIALGEVIVADATVTGAGVVLAQRIEQLAAADGVNITGAIDEALPRRLPVARESLGERRLKGFDDPVRVVRVTAADGASMPPPDATSTTKRDPRPRWAMMIGAIAVVAATAAAAYLLLTPDDPNSRTTTATTDRPSLAVLPFDNLGGDPEQEYFADGITEDLTTDLSRISGLFVVARNSAFSYKGQSRDVREIAKELDVRYVLEGSVRRVAGQVRINAQLIDGTSGGHVWAERFDGTMADVFALQDDVNRRIVEALEVSLTSREREMMEAVETADPQAYDLLLRGVTQYQLFAADNNRAAREYFLRAIERDPDYARAYANVAMTHATDVNFYWSDDRDASIRQGLEYADRASALDDTIPQIYLTRSLLFHAQRKHDAAVQSAKHMVSVHPNYADGFATLAFVQSFSGDNAEALQAIRTAKTIDPNYSYIFLAVEGRILFQLHRYEEALGILEQSVLRNPAFQQGQLLVAATNAELDRVDDAEWAIQEALAINPDLSLAQVRSEANYRNAEELEHFLAALAKAGLP